MTASWKYSLGFLCWISIDNLIVPTSKLHDLLLTIDTLHKQLLLLTHYFHGFILIGRSSLTWFFCCGSILQWRLFLFVCRKSLLLLLAHNETTIQFNLWLFPDTIHDTAVACVIILFNRLKIRHPSAVHTSGTWFPWDLFVRIHNPGYQQTWVSLSGEEGEGTATLGDHLDKWLSLIILLALSSKYCLN